MSTVLGVQKDDMMFMRNAACRNHDPRLFETNTTSQGKTPVDKVFITVNGRKISRADAIARAKKTCSSCPVKLDCKDFIEKYPTPEGIWAGLLPEER